MEGDFPLFATKNARDILFSLHFILLPF